MNKNIETVDLKAFVKKLTRLRLRQKLCVSDQSISNALTRGRLPATWYRKTTELAKSLNIPVEDKYFDQL